MNDIIKRGPFSLIDELQRDMNRLFETRLVPTWYNDAGLPAKNAWVPAVDIEEKADCYRIAVDVPGIKPEAIEVTAHDNYLSIKGKREQVTENKELKRSERVFGSFLREFTMPQNAALDKISAQANHGVLEITVPKTSKSEPRRIAVEKS